MTYNFDPERWFEIQRAALDDALERGEIDAAEHARRLAELTERFERMLDRVDIRHDYREK